MHIRIKVHGALSLTGLKNSFRNRRRTLLTVCSLAFSLCLLGLMITIYFTLYMSETPPSQALRLATRNRVSITLPMPAFYLQRILHPA